MADQIKALIAEAREAATAQPEVTTDEREAPVNYCPEHGDLIANREESRRSLRCYQAHTIPEILADFRRQGAPVTQDELEEAVNRILFKYEWNPQYTVGDATTEFMSLFHLTRKAETDE